MLLSPVEGESAPKTFLASTVEATIRMIEPGTSAVSDPVAPMSPTTKGPNSSLETSRSDSSILSPESPGPATRRAVGDADLTGG